MAGKKGKFSSLSEIPGVVVETGKAAELLRKAFSGHHYRHEDLLKPEVVEDLGKLEDLMADVKKPYWSAQEIREAMGVREDDLPKRHYVGSLISYLRDEDRITTGGPNALGSYVLTKRADEITQREMNRQTGSMQINS